MAEFTDVLKVVLRVVDQATAPLKGVQVAFEGINSKIQLLGKELGPAGAGQTMIEGLNKPRLMAQALSQSLASREGFTGAMESVQNEVAKVDKQFSKTTRTTKTFSQIVDQAATKSLKNLQITTKVTTTALRALQNALLGMGLSMLFTGMAMKRFVDTALKGMINTYKMAIGEQGAFNVATNQLAAAWAFFKFSFLDALASTGMFEILLGWVIQLLNWFAKLPRAIRLFVVIGLVVLSVVTAMMMVVGQTLLFFLTFVALQIAAAAWNATMAAALVKVLLGFLAVLGVLFVFILAITLIVLIMESELPKGIKVFLILLVVIAAIVTIMAILGVSISLPFVIVAVLIAAIIGLFVKLADELGGVKNAFRALGIFALAILAFVGDAIFEALITPLRLFIGVINAAIRGMHALGIGLRIKEIDLPKIGMLSRKVLEMRDKLLAEVSAEKALGEKEPPSKTLGIDGLKDLISGQGADQSNLLAENNNLLGQLLDVNTEQLEKDIGITIGGEGVEDVEARLEALDAGGNGAPVR